MLWRRAERSFLNSGDGSAPLFQEWASLGAEIGARVRLIPNAATLTCGTSRKKERRCQSYLQRQPLPGRGSGDTVASARLLGVCVTWSRCEGGATQRCVTFTSRRTRYGLKRT
ncbi:unnamed protein product [Lota lota]